MRVLGGGGRVEKHVRLLIGSCLDAYHFTGIGLDDSCVVFCCLYFKSAAD